MADNRFKQNIENSFVADYDTSIHRCEGSENIGIKLFPLHSGERVQSVYGLFWSKLLRRKHSVLPDSSSYILNLFMDKRMAILNIALLAFNMFTIAQVKETPDMVNYGVLTGMIATLVAYVYFLHKKYDKRIEDMTKEHKDERAEWREAMEKQHQETRETMKEVTKIQHEDSVATTNALRELHVLIQNLRLKGGY